MAFEKKEGRLATNEHGFLCEAAFRDALTELRIPFVWGTWFDDHKLKTDCWLGPKQIAINLTVLSSGEKLDDKARECLAVGVALVCLHGDMVLRAANGSVKDLDALERELLVQLPPQLKKLNGNRMTREKAVRLAAARR